MAAHISLVIADDHRIVRQGMRTLLETQAGLSVVGEATDGLELVRLVETLRPAVALVDITMPNLNGLDATRQLHKRFPETAVVILSMHASLVYIARALNCGAWGYVLKDDSLPEIVAAIQHAARRERYLCRRVADQLAEALMRGLDLEELASEQRLTDREQEILQLIAEGNTNAQVAEKLGISQRTVETHRANLMDKLGLTSQAGLIRYAIRQGVVSLDE